MAKVDQNGNEYEYRVMEHQVAGYTATYGDEKLPDPLTNNITNPLKITNTLAQEPVTVQGQKTWVDGGLKFETREELINFWQEVNETDLTKRQMKTEYRKKINQAVAVTGSSLMM